jgi:hypothetical protein
VPLRPSFGEGSLDGEDEDARRTQSR